MVALRLENITKSYGQTKVIDSVNCEVAHGELMVLVGPSGCGKTTLLKIILGDVHPDSGNVYVDGKLINHVSIENRNIGFVPQDFGLFPHLTVYENIGYGLKVRKVSDKQLSAQVNNMIHMLQLHGLEARTSDQLSWGQQQRVALARALAIEPSLLLLDEPLSAVDWSSRLEITKQIKTLQKRLKITTMYVTHDIDEALDLGHRVIVMNCGNLEQCDTPENLIENPRTPFVKQFIRRLRAAN